MTHLCSSEVVLLKGLIIGMKGKQEVKWPLFHWNHFHALLAPACYHQTGEPKVGNTDVSGSGRCHRS